MEPSLWPREELFSPENPNISPVKYTLFYSSGPSAEIGVARNFYSLNEYFAEQLRFPTKRKLSPFCTGTAMSLSATEIDVRTVLHMFQLVKMKENPGQWKLWRLQYCVLHYPAGKADYNFSSYPERQWINICFTSLGELIHSNHDSHKQTEIIKKKKSKTSNRKENKPYTQQVITLAKKMSHEGWKGAICCAVAQHHAPHTEWLLWGQTGPARGLVTSSHLGDTKAPWNRVASGASAAASHSPGTWDTPCPLWSRREGRKLQLSSLDFASSKEVPQLGRAKPVWGLVS